MQSMTNYEGLEVLGGFGEVNMGKWGRFGGNSNYTGIIEESQSFGANLNPFQNDSIGCISG